MKEKSAEGVRGFLLFVGEEPVFRVYDSLDRKQYTDYEIRHDDLEVQIVGRYASLFQGDGDFISYPTRLKENAVRRMKERG